MLQWIKVNFITSIVCVLLIIPLNIFLIDKFYKYDNLKSISDRFFKQLSFSNETQIPLFVKTIKNHTMFYKAKIPKDTNFFFLETSGRSRLTLKELCALESAANIDLTYVFKGTVIENLWLQNRIQKSVHYNSHMSDILRYWFVYNYGGTYLDSDVIVLKEMPINYNFAGVENVDSFLVASGIIHFTQHHKLLKMILADISKNFDGTAWINNGPAMFTSNLIKLCKATTMETINRGKCHNIQLLPPNAFYSIYYPSWQLYFDTGSKEVVKKQLNNSLVAHYWGKLSSKTKVKSGMPIYDLALEKCPVIAKYFK
ncbi:A4GALT [Lepeophtheirus salmonis]|uniref:A4GALT n=1 Tax=Lepeophtheirus salmonis TaxID=72036 RepID=A0A7R8H455_LEPSM|nr:A4GALT [Lepeophtheirus salmonis]CAF2851902.1 A4GALT [Lepeophtheirus salmonis]